MSKKADIEKKAIILLSGGLDSSTVLYNALYQGYKVDAISFEYQQKHNIELEYARKIALKARIDNHVIIQLDPTFGSSSALIGKVGVPKNRIISDQENDIPVTYVPARNLIFLSIAAGYAETQNIQNIFIGVNAVDYSGYPDCRPDFIESFTRTANLGTKAGRIGEGIIIHTPLANMKKEEIIELGISLGVPYEMTWSCYDPIFDKYGKALPCQGCDSCKLREMGFQKYQSKISNE